MSFSVLGVLLIGTAVAVARSILASEARALIPHLSDLVIRFAARQVPCEHRDRYLEEWRAEAHQLGDRPLCELLWAARVGLRSHALRRDLNRGPSLVYGLRVLGWQTARLFALRRVRWGYLASNAIILFVLRGYLAGKFSWLRYGPSGTGVTGESILGNSLGVLFCNSVMFTLARVGRERLVPRCTVCDATADDGEWDFEVLDEVVADGRTLCPSCAARVGAQRR